MKVQFRGYKLSRVALNKRFCGYKNSRYRKSLYPRKFIPIKYQKRVDELTVKNIFYFWTDELTVKNNSFLDWWVDFLKNVISKLWLSKNKLFLDWWTDYQKMFISELMDLLSKKQIISELMDWLSKICISGLMDWRIMWNHYHWDTESLGRVLQNIFIAFLCLPRLDWK